MSFVTDRGIQLEFADALLALCSLRVRCKEPKPLFFVCLRRKTAAQASHGGGRASRDKEGQPSQPFVWVGIEHNNLVGIARKILCIEFYFLSIQS